MPTTYLRAGTSMSTVVFVLIGIAACGFTRGLFNRTLDRFLLDLCIGVIGAVEIDRVTLAPSIPRSDASGQRSN
jgi:hypothetical protein